MLYYIHGYQSSPNSAKGTLFKEKLGARAIKYRDCEPDALVVYDCLRRIANEIENDSDAVLIGSSFGGFLAAKTALEHSNIKKLVLFNPTIIPPSEDINNIEGIPHRILLEMKDNRLFEEKINAEIVILRGIDDGVVPPHWVLEFAMAQEATVRFLRDDHSFTRNIDRLPDFIF